MNQEEEFERNLKKFSSYNPLKNIAIACFCEAIKKEIKTELANGARNFLDLGCGEGIVLTDVFGEYGIIPNSIVGVDNNPFALNYANQQGHIGKYVLADIMEYEPDPKPDVVLCLEVMEHLPKANELITKIAGYSDKAIITIPNPKLFNLVANKDAVEVHVNQWNKKNLENALCPWFNEVKIRRIGLFWLMATCKGSFLNK